MHTTPSSLLERLRQPAEQADWARFVQLYTPLLYYWARQSGSQEQDASDLVQDVFLVLIEKLPNFQYDERKSFRGWLRTIVINKWRDRRRLQARQPPHEALEDDHPEPAKGDAFEEAEYRQYVTARALRLMQADFRPSTWKAFWEHRVVGRPAAAVARELGITENAVFVNASKVLRRLREELKGLVD